MGDSRLFFLTGFQQIHLHQFSSEIWFVKLLVQNGLVKLLQLKQA